MVQNLLDLPPGILSDILIHLEPHNIQRLRRCYSLLASLLRLAPITASEPCRDFGDDGRGPLRLIGLSFALHNLRLTVEVMPGQVIRRTPRDQLNVGRLGPYYLAALFCDYGFSVDVLTAAFRHLYRCGNWCDWREVASAAMTIIKYDEPVKENYLALAADFMTCRIAKLITAAVRTAVSQPRLAKSFSDLFSDEMAKWILLLDDIQLLEAFLGLLRNTDGLLQNTGVPYGLDDHYLLKRAVQCGALRIVRYLVLTREPPVSPTPEALEAAVFLGKASMVQFFVADVPAHIIPRRDLMSDILAEIFRPHGLESAEVFLEIGGAGLDTPVTADIGV
ncbi:hypothetical protein HK405_004363 [Cladochytrium tenue]|nr:hypothetical protein HK405_004363 [Cladochytrium tenue]